MSAIPQRDRRAAFLADPALMSALARFVRTRVPNAEVEDIVQSTLADALASGAPPASDAELRPWIFGIARNKVIDFFRRTRREVARDDEDEQAAEGAPESARDLLRWAERELPSGDGAESTLEWMLREGAGEKLEAIAAEENVPAPRVRQRVARLRKHFRARWAAELAAVAALVLVALAIWVAWKRKANDVAVPEPAPTTTNSAPLPAPREPTAEERAAELRRDAFDSCDAKQWQHCLEKLDAAKALDPAGDADARVQRARAAIQRELPPTTKDAPKPRPAPRAVSTAPSTMPAPSTMSAPSTTPAPPAPAPLSPKAGPKVPTNVDSFGSK